MGTQQNLRTRGRQVGKTAETAREIASRTGLQFETVLDLMRTGWSYAEFKGEWRWTR